MAAETSRSISPADSYIGSLISLTSKSEIRYEGVLYTINTEESSIGLRDARSFGTEGRKKDDPQVPPSDKVFEYILFRGSDVKDLQVKSSPPVQNLQTTSAINSDPAIIQSHYPHPAPTASSMPYVVSGSLTDFNSQTPQLGHPRSTFQGGLPLYQPGGNLGSWGPSPPPPSVNGSGLAMPMYWQGYYGPPNSLPHFPQEPLLRPPPGSSVPPMQQPMQYSGYNASLPPATSNLPVSNLPEYPSFIPASTGSISFGSTSLPPFTLPSALPPASSVKLVPETLPNAIPNKTPISVLPTVTPSTSLPSLSPLATSNPGITAIVPPISNKPNAISSPALPFQTISQPMSYGGTSSSSRTESPIPSLITPGQLLQSGPAAISASQASKMTHKDVEVVQLSSSLSKPSAPVATEAQPPILPLPQASHVSQKPNGPPFQTRHSYRGYRERERGRGTGSSRPVTKFTEDFDFMAMNEKFKKDEVWGHLGKSNRSHIKDKEGDGKGSDTDDSQDEEDAETSKAEIKPVYNKDDFFDSFSCNALGHESNNGRTRFSEQIKIDTETFGDFPRYRGGRGGPFRGGRFRGRYYGRGYGHVGRGRARGMSSQAP